jgi:hypothetical protein
MSDTEEIHEARLNYFNFASKKVNEHITYTISLFILLFTTIQSNIFPTIPNVMIFGVIIPIICYTFLRTSYWSGYADVSIWVNPHEYLSVEEIRIKTNLQVIQDSVTLWRDTLQQNKKITRFTRIKWEFLKKINFIKFITYYIPYLIAMIINFTFIPLNEIYILIYNIGLAFVICIFYCIFKYTLEKKEPLRMTRPS